MAKSISKDKWNFALLKAIREKGFKQKDFARLVGDDETRVSRIINGIWNPDEVRKLKYARTLKMKVEELFPDEGNVIKKVINQEQNIQKK